MILWMLLTLSLPLQADVDGKIRELERRVSTGDESARLPLARLYLSSDRPEAVGRLRPWMEQPELGGLDLQSFGLVLPADPDELFFMATESRAGMTLRWLLLELDAGTLGATLDRERIRRIKIIGTDYGRSEISLRLNRDDLTSRTRSREAGARLKEQFLVFISRTLDFLDGQEGDSAFVKRHHELLRNFGPIYPRVRFAEPPRSVCEALNLP